MTVDVRVPPNNDEEFIQRLHVLEGNVDHMYLDEGCNVTIGRGIHLESFDQAMGLEYYYREDASMTPVKDEAKKTAVQTDWDRVLKVAGEKERESRRSYQALQGHRLERVFKTKGTSHRAECDHKIARNRIQEAL